jgi:5'-nucleotidase (lipoprotein e(P4) family)
VQALPRDVHWFRNSAEYRAIAIETYRAATARITELARNAPAGAWTVVLDIDETTLDNSEFQRRLAVTGATYSDSTWNAWVRERAAPAVPGAVAFMNTVHSVGGRVALVSNRDDIVCSETRSNLRTMGIHADVVLCRVNHVSDKNPRFDALQNGTAAAGLPPLRILLWVGDNIQDFPHLTQDVRATPGGFELFGDRYFMLPNPMYGSWEANERS